MRELLRLSGAYRCPLRDDKGERVCGLLLPCLRTRLRFPQGESLKFSVSVGTMFSAVGHLQGSVRTDILALYKISNSTALLGQILKISLLRVQSTFSTFSLLVLYDNVTVSIAWIIPVS